MERRYWQSIALLIIAAQACGPDDSGVRKTNSRLVDGHVHLESRASFLLPEPWIEWYRQYGNNVHLTRDELEAVREGFGEWDREYAEIVNAILPFETCAAHVGGEGWGREAVSWGDLQMRAYLGQFDADVIRRAVVSSGRDRALRFSSVVVVDSVNMSGWATTSLQFDLWYGDYGGTAHVAFHCQRHRSETAVLVSMYAWPEREKYVRAILNSFRWSG